MRTTEVFTIIGDDQLLDEFLETLDEPEEGYAYIILVMARNKYSEVSSRDTTLRQELITKKGRIKEFLHGMEVPVYTFKDRQKCVVTQDNLAVYISVNTISIRDMGLRMVNELTSALANGSNIFMNRLVSSLSHKAKHSRKNLCFDIDNDELPPLEGFLPSESYRVIKTRGGFHLTISLDKTNNKTGWYKYLSAHVDKSVKLTVIPGCVQGGFVPYIIKGHNAAEVTKIPNASK